MSLRVRCNDRSGCVAEADVPRDWHHADLDEHETLAIYELPRGWTSNHGLGGVSLDFCPAHQQPEIAGG